MMQCLEKAGFKMDADLIPGDIGNRYGYYESRRFKALCINVARDHALGLDLKVEEFRELLDRKGKWAWKYPKAVFLLNVIVAAAKNMVVIYMDRPKKDAISSMIRRSVIKKITPSSEEEYSQWYEGSLKAINAYEHRKIKVSFLDLVKNEKKVMNEVLEFLGMEPNYNYTTVDIKEVHFIEE